MRDLVTRHHSHLQPEMSPELMSWPISPSDPGYSSPQEYASPAESDALQTPSFERYQAKKLESGSHIRSHSHEEEDDRSFGPEFLKLPQLFLQASPTSTHKDDGTFPPFPVITAPGYGSHIDVDPFAAEFSHQFSHLDEPQYESSPIHAVPSNLDARPLRSTNEPETLPHNLDAGVHSSHFPVGHRLNPHFVRHYQLEDELGSGGYGFVMTALHRSKGCEVAVKFIIKSKVPDHAWMEDETIGRLPTEVMLLSFIDHENIVKCLDLFEDSLYFYLIQELHGSPWPKAIRTQRKTIATSLSSLAPSTPTLSPSMSTSSLASSERSSSPASPSIPPNYVQPPHGKSHSSPLPDTSTTIPVLVPRPEFSRRPSHDLFECIEQSAHKRLSERQARYVFSQVVDAVYYLDSQGVTHRDIKDENLVIDRDLKVKLIDFGSATVVDPNEPRPYYKLFYGTTAYAAPEILLKKEYQAPPAEIWTLGVLLSYLLTGSSPFPTVKDATNGRIVLADIPDARLSRTAMSLMRRCLDPDPRTRATISEVREHRWLM